MRMETVLLLHTCVNEAMVKIERSSNGRVVLRLSGWIEIEDIPELQRILGLEAPGREIVLDLGDITLVDRGTVKFLGDCEENDVKLENCPGYIREWIDSDRSRDGRRRG
jgi:hypothetical protein